MRRKPGPYRALFRIGAEDVSAIRFGVSPAHELAGAVRVLSSPASHPLHWGWLRSLRGRVPTDAFEVVAAVVGTHGYFPDFLTEPPRWDATPESSLCHIRDVPLEDFGRDLLHALDHRQPSPGAAGAAERVTLTRLLGNPERGRVELADSWATLWSALLAPDWPQLERILRADIGLRVRRVAEVGLAAMVDGLHATVGWDLDAVRVETLTYNGDIDCAGSGLVLVPSVMTSMRCTVLTHIPTQPAIFYPALGVDERWQRVRDPAPLAGVLGSGRAAVLLGLDAPRSTSEVGELCDLAVSTASLHLSRLRAAGLVDSRRDGSQVVHVRSPLGEALVSGPHPAG
ncbi:MAG: helix-turn-helix domain-containing protein [Phycicoccus sp.]